MIFAVRAREMNFSQNKKTLLLCLFTLIYPSVLFNKKNKQKEEVSKGGYFFVSRMILKRSFSTIGEKI